MKSEIDKIKAVLSEINEDESHILAGRQGTIIIILTKALEIAVDALGATWPGDYGRVVKDHHNIHIKQISEILGDK